MVSDLVGWEQTTQGPVQKEESFLAAPGLVVGVKSQTLVPGWKVFLSWWYCRRWRLTVAARC